MEILQITLVFGISALSILVEQWWYNWGKFIFPYLMAIHCFGTNKAHYSGKNDVCVVHYNPIDLCAPLGDGHGFYFFLDCVMKTMGKQCNKFCHGWLTDLNRSIHIDIWVWNFSWENVHHIFWCVFWKLQWIDTSPNNGFKGGGGASKFYFFSHFWLLNHATPLFYTQMTPGRS